MFCCWRALASIFFRLWRNNDTIYLWLFLCRRNSRIDSWQCQLNRAGTVAIEVTRIIDADYVLAWHRFVGKDCENMTISRIPWPSKSNRRVLNTRVVPSYVSFNLRTNEWNILIGISSHSCVTRSWNLWIRQILLFSFSIVAVRGQQFQHPWKSWAKRLKKKNGNGSISCKKNTSES